MGLAKEQYTTQLAEEATGVSTLGSDYPLGEHLLSPEESLREEFYLFAHSCQMIDHMQLTGIDVSDELIDGHLTRRISLMTNLRETRVDQELDEELDELFTTIGISVAHPDDDWRSVIDEFELTLGDKVPRAARKYLEQKYEEADLVFIDEEIDTSVLNLTPEQSQKLQQLGLYTKVTSLISMVRGYTRLPIIRTNHRDHEERRKIRDKEEKLLGRFSSF